MNASSIPNTCDVLVIGGGPAGSGTATLLAREGLDVVLLDKVKHPRPKVGESIIPHFWRFADLLGVTEKIDREGFLVKAGGIVTWEGIIQQIRFSSFGYTDKGGLHVERDRFDLILLQHAAACGARIWEEVAVRGVDFSDPSRPVVLYEDWRGGGASQGRITCRYVVDASGPAAVLAGQFNARRLVKTDGRFLGLWGYYENAYYLGVDRKVHPPQMAREIKPVTFVTSYEDGWAWHIILRDNTSVGLVMNVDRIRGKGKKAQEQYFRETCASIPYLRDLLAPARFIEDSMHFRPDYSYYSEKVSGEGFFCVGDAAAFVDPIFSQGVVAAVYNAAIAAWAIKASLKNHQRRQFYREIFDHKLLSFYSFSRLLAFGDFGGEGINPDLVKAFVTSLPVQELELSLAASTALRRSENLRRMAYETGLIDQFDANFVSNKVELLDGLQW